VVITPPRGLDHLYFDLKRIHGLKEPGYTKGLVLLGKAFGTKIKTWWASFGKNKFRIVGYPLAIEVCIVWDFVHFSVLSICI